jgi:type II secretory pathway component PulF
MSQPNNDASFPRRGMTAGEAHDLTVAVADVTAAGLPLVDGLRAAAAETHSRRVAAELRHIADGAAAGQSLDKVLGDRRRSLPAYVAGLIRAGVRTGDLGNVLIELVDHQQTVRDMWRTIRSALAYPTLLLVLTLAIGLWIQYFLVGPMMEMFEEFEMELPSVTQFLAWTHEHAVRWCLGIVSAVLVAATVTRAVGGAARWRRVLCSLPIIGVLWHWSGVAELTRVLSVLVTRGVPLPEALQLAAGGTRAPDMRRAAWELAAGVKQGGTLSELVTGSSRLPPTLAPVIAWGEQSGELGEAFRQAGAMFEGRVMMRAELVRSMVPPLMFVFIATGVLAIVFGLYAPLFTLIQDLA